MHPGFNSRGPSFGPLSNGGSAANYFAGIKIPADHIDSFNDPNEAVAVDAVSTFCSGGLSDVKAF